MRIKRTSYAPTPCPATSSWDGRDTCVEGKRCYVPNKADYDRFYGDIKRLLNAFWRRGYVKKYPNKGEFMRVFKLAWNVREYV